MNPIQRPLKQVPKQTLDASQSPFPQRWATRTPRDRSSAETRVKRCGAHETGRSAQPSAHPATLPKAPENRGVNDAVDASLPSDHPQPHTGHVIGMRGGGPPC